MPYIEDKLDKHVKCVYHFYMCMDSQKCIQMHDSCCSLLECILCICCPNLLQYLCIYNTCHLNSKRGSVLFTRVIDWVIIVQAYNSRKLYFDF